MADCLWQQWLPDADQQPGAAAAHMCRVGTLGFAPGFPFGGLERGKKDLFGCAVSRDVVPIPLLSSRYSLEPPSQLQASLRPLCTHSASVCC